MDPLAVATMVSAFAGLVGVGWGIWHGRKTAGDIASEVTNAALTSLNAALDRQGSEIRDLRKRIVQALDAVRRCEDEKGGLESRIQELERAS